MYLLFLFLFGYHLISFLHSFANFNPKAGLRSRPLTIALTFKRKIIFSLHIFSIVNHKKAYTLLAKYHYLIAFDNKTIIFLDPLNDFCHCEFIYSSTCIFNQNCPETKVLSIKNSWSCKKHNMTLSRYQRTTIRWYNCSIGMEIYCFFQLSKKNILNIL